MLAWLTRPNVRTVMLMIHICTGIARFCQDIPQQFDSLGKFEEWPQHAVPWLASPISTSVAVMSTFLVYLGYECPAFSSGSLVCASPVCGLVHATEKDTCSVDRAHLLAGFVWRSANRPVSEEN